MSEKIVIVKYPRVLRALNRVDSFPNDDTEKISLMTLLTSLVDAYIQKCLHEPETQCKTSTIELSVTKKDVDMLLKALDEKNVVLYEGMSNEDALIVSPKK